MTAMLLRAVPAMVGNGASFGASPLRRRARLLPTLRSPHSLMQFWIIQTLNSVTFGGLLFLLSAGFSLAFGLMRIPNLAHGGFFMLGAYFGATIVSRGGNFWLAVLASGVGVGLIGILFERLILRRLAGNVQGQVLVTLGFSFIIADLCLLIWTGDPWTLPAPEGLRPPLRFAGYAFPTFRLVVLGLAILAAIALYFLMDRTRLGAMIRAGVDDMEMARGVGIPVSLLFTVVFFLGAVLAGLGGALGAPMLNAYPGLDTDMLPLALIVVILGGAGSLKGAFIGSFVVGFLYNFGIARFPDLAYFILFLPMVLVLVFRPQGLFGRVPS
jgi:branched-chain amino acid transport system permease protein